MQDRIFELTIDSAFIGEGAGPLEDDVVKSGTLLVLEGTPEECTALAEQTGRVVFPIAPDWIDQGEGGTMRPYQVEP